LRRLLVPLLAVVFAALVPRQLAAQQIPDLVTRDVLRVCADPADMPFSNRKGEGFENRIAAIIADELKVPLRYYWLQHGLGFVRNTLGAKLCDLIVGDAAGTELVQHTNPYYRSAYVLLARRGELAGVRQISDLKGSSKRLAVVAGTPPGDHLAEHGLMVQVTTYPFVAEHGYETPAAEMVADLAAGRIDVAILWGPGAGYLARQSGVAMDLVPLVKEDRPALTFRIALGVRLNENEWKRTLNAVLRRREAEITKVLLDYGVPLLDDEDNLIAGGPAHSGGQ
jgi:quinoprotein dehydrogenase-associated probable ABC transporter substrate-binding protein